MRRTTPNNMAADARLTDEQLVRELAKYGEKVELPLKRGKKPVLLKKLNHLIVRSQKEKAAVSPSSKIIRSSPSAFVSKFQGREIETKLQENDYDHIPKSSIASSYSRDARTRYTPDTSHRSYFKPLVSDDSEDETPPSSSNRHHDNDRSSSYRNLDDKIPSANRRSIAQSTHDNYSSNLSNSVPRTLQHRTATSSRAYDIGNENRTFSRLDDDEKLHSPPRSRLYPSLSEFTSSSSHLLSGGTDRYESSDSDEQVNKSFPFSFNDTRHRDASSSSSFLSGRHQKSVGDPYRAKQQRSPYPAHLPRIIVIAVILFFVVVAVTYTIRHRDLLLSWFPSSGSDDIILVCSNATKNEVCYEKEMVDKALLYLGKLFESLSLKKGQVLCGDAKPGEEFITIINLQAQMYKHFSDNTNVELLLECCLQHILVNPHWNIGALQANGTVARNKGEVARLESEAPLMSVLCRLRRSCYTVFYELCLTAAAIAVFVLTFMYFKYRLKKRNLEQREVYSMVDEIIDILQDHYEQTRGSDEPPYLAVQHVRDQLLPPSTRHKLQPVWDKAVAFIAANESRVRLETRLIQGDEFEVWQWLQPPVPDSRRKNSPGLVVKHIERDRHVSERPTVCLKICKMFNSSLESDDDWKDQVINAVLEKCRGIDSIVHTCINPEIEEGCVFMKCSDLEAAVNAKDELHGWRRKGRAATVKYMKTDEYHKLFPDAHKATRPLHPPPRARMY